jgi:DNA (cytosine-5)-methyltransferase 1
VFDTFAGCGGFSEGARQAGARVAFACDSDPYALATHAANHLDTVHELLSLPCEIPLPIDGRTKFHLHGSPPCQRFSNVANGTRFKVPETESLALVEWYLEFALQSGASTWSMEQVAAPPVVRLLEETIKKHGRDRVTYGVFDMQQFGVPQTRTRLIAGPPQLIAALWRCASKDNVRSIRDALSTPRGKFIRNGSCWYKRSRNDITKEWIYHKAGIFDHCVPVSKPAPTVLARRAPTWVTPLPDGGARTSMVTAEESSALQTFPAWYHWLDGTQADKLQIIGNAVPPRFAKILMEQAMRIAQTAHDVR